MRPVAATMRTHIVPTRENRSRLRTAIRSPSGRSRRRCGAIRRRKAPIAPSHTAAAIRCRMSLIRCTVPAAPPVAPACPDQTSVAVATEPAVASAAAAAVGQRVIRSATASASRSVALRQSQAIPTSVSRTRSRKGRSSSERSPTPCIEAASTAIPRVERSSPAAHSHRSARQIAAIAVRGSRRSLDVSA